MSRRRILNSL